MLTLLVLVSISLTTYGMNIGDECQSGLSTYPAKCVPYSLCKLQEWTIENMKNGICDFQGEPVSISVCCPTQLLSSNFITSAPANFTTNAPTNFTKVHKESFILFKSGRKVKYDTQIVGSLAKAKCMENAYVFEKTAMYNNTNQKRCPIEIRNTSFRNTSFISTLETYPHMAMFGYGSDSSGIRWNYGGNLISDNVILTAARWTTSPWGAPKWAGFGLNRTLTQLIRLQILDIEEVITHPEYNSSRKEHDIAIVRLEGKVRYDEWARPACLSTNWYNLANNNNKTMLVGWLPYRLELIVTYIAEIVDYGLCKRILQEEHPISVNNTICAEYEVVSCKQPLYVIDFNKDYECMYDIIGIGNMKFPCNFDLRLFTHINRYMSWIEKAAWPEYF